MLKTPNMPRLAVAALSASLIGGAASAQLLITEVHSKSQTDPEDFFELTNLGLSPVDITGWQFDDESADIADAAPITGITSIAPGESVVIFQLDENDPSDAAYDPAGETVLFRNYWGGLSGVQVGYHGGAGLGKGDAITLFDSGDAIALQLEYGMTSPEQTHAGDWAAGNTDGSDTFENESAIWVPGTDPAEYVLAADGVFGSFANSDGNFGSPGVVPEPAAAAILGVAGLGLLRQRSRG
ncbi:MAG: lamin tail domain-containing protein [Planctomycetota bacterium]